MCAEERLVRVGDLPLPAFMKCQHCPIKRNIVLSCFCFFYLYLQKLRMPVAWEADAGYRACMCRYAPVV